MKVDESGGNYWKKRVRVQRADCVDCLGMFSYHNNIEEKDTLKMMEKPGEKGQFKVQVFFITISCSSVALLQTLKLFLGAQWDSVCARSPKKEMDGK